jgi:hypothetical protein
MAIWGLERSRRRCSTRTSATTPHQLPVPHDLDAGRCSSPPRRRRSSPLPCCSPPGATTPLYTRDGRSWTPASATTPAQLPTDDQFQGGASVSQAHLGQRPSSAVAGNPKRSRRRRLGCGQGGERWERWGM